ncbi:unnamed protein product [Rotaria sordida]|uniref:Helicase ATP-binding domain-containing protein n=1 Tax=Rotaria sordida TaxID=392033 RepID=A0A818YIR3_9BILA|nr:unnamed protein product [Rotaria sordida]
MKRAPFESTVISTSCSPAKHPKLDVSCNTTVNIDDITIAQDSVIIPRSYQTELVEQAKDENLIVCLPTGSGKTYIAVMLIKELAQETRKSIHDGGKRTVFLVKTVVLVQQQSDYIRIHTDLTVGTYYGQKSSVGSTAMTAKYKRQTIKEFRTGEINVLVATAVVEEGLDIPKSCGLHRKILHNSTDLFGHISSYAGDEDVFPKDQSVDQYLSKVFTLQ